MFQHKRSHMDPYMIMQYTSTCRTGLARYWPDWMPSKVLTLHCHNLHIPRGRKKYFPPCACVMVWILFLFKNVPPHIIKIPAKKQKNIKTIERGSLKTKTCHSPGPGHCSSKKKGEHPKSHVQHPRERIVPFRLWWKRHIPSTCSGGHAIQILRKIHTRFCKTPRS